MATFKTFFGANTGPAGPASYTLTATSAALALTGTTTNLTYDGPLTIVIGTPNTLGSAFGIDPPHRLAQTFVSVGVSITNIRGWLRKNGSPTDGVYVRLYTVDANHFPLTEIAVSANGIHSSSMTTSELPFDFEFTPAVPVTVGVEYALVYNRTGAISSTHFYYLGVNSANPYPFGNHSFYDGPGGTWINISSYDVVSVITQEAAADGAYELTATTGALALTGNDANLTPSGAPAVYTLTTITAALVLTGTTTTFTGAWRLTAAPTDLALAGNTAGLNKTGFFTLVATTGALAFNGTSTNFTRAAVLTATPQTLALTSNTVELVRGLTLTATSAALTLTGNVANLVKSGAFALTALSSTLALDARPVNFLSAWRLTASAGALVLAGTTTGLWRGFALGALAGALSLTGTTVGFLRSAVMEALRGLLALFGRDAGLVHVAIKRYTLVARSGSLQLEGRQVDLAARLLEKQPGPLVFGRRLILHPHHW
jgi:hypothetical protein